jgi:Ni/Co efflux regulator RcnB
MILDFETYCLNEKMSVKSIKKTIHGALNSKNRLLMKKILRKNVVYFDFMKKDGTLRHAIGTLVSDYLPALKGGAPKPEHQFVYYDMVKKHWRSFRTFSFIKIINVKSISEYEDKISDEELKRKKEEEKKEKEKLHKEKLEREKEEEIEDTTSEDEETEKDKEDIKHKTYKPGEKIPEKELMRRSTDFIKDTRKNKLNKKSNDAYKKGDLDEDDEDEDED